MSNEDVALEYFRSAREELLFRVKHRDDWFKLAILAQAVLWGLGKGVKIGGAEPLAPMPEMLILHSRYLAYSLAYTTLRIASASVFQNTSEHCQSVVRLPAKITK